jgi:hypothetical protein
MTRLGYLVNYLFASGSCADILAVAREEMRQVKCLTTAQLTTGLNKELDRRGSRPKTMKSTRLRDLSALHLQAPCVSEGRHCVRCPRGAETGESQIDSTKSIRVNAKIHQKVIGKDLGRESGSCIFEPSRADNRWDVFQEIDVPESGRCG